MPAIVADRSGTAAAAVRGLADRAGREARGLFRRGVPAGPRLLLAAARVLPDFAAASTRAWLYRRAGFALGRGVALLGRLRLVGDGDVRGRLQVGEGSIIAPGVTLALDAAVRLGRNVSIGPGVVLYTATHAVGFGSRRMSLSVAAKPVVIEDGAWVGMYSLVLPGVTVGRGAVVAAGSVVTEDVPPNALVGGNPAVVRQTLPFGDR